MTTAFPYWEYRPGGWATDNQILREFDRPVTVSEALLATLLEAVDTWPELDEMPPMTKLANLDIINMLAEDWMPGDRKEFRSIEFKSGGLVVNIIYGATSVRILIKRSV
jgi:hypothetical protein